LLSALNTALWPRASGLTDPQQLFRLLRKTMGITTLVAGLGVAYSLLAPSVAPIVFGEAYEKSRVIAHILCIRYCIALFASPLGLIGYGFGLVRVYWKINLLQFVVLLVVMWIFLPLFGPLGAAAALVCMEAAGDLVVLAFILCSYVKYVRICRDQRGAATPCGESED